MKEQEQATGFVRIRRVKQESGSRPRRSIKRRMCNRCQAQWRGLGKKMSSIDRTARPGLLTPKGGLLFGRSSLFCKEGMQTWGHKEKKEEGIGHPGYVGIKLAMSVLPPVCVDCSLMAPST
jgi:hypothetical protein